jgi:Transposase DDE domain
LHPKRLTWEYVTAKGARLVCKSRALCTRSRTGRTIHRHRDHVLLEKARNVANSKAAKADLKRRQHLMERSFADAANRHGLKRSRWRGLWKQAIQDLLIATVQSLRKLLRHLSQTEPELAYRLTQLLDCLSRHRAFPGQVDLLSGLFSSPSIASPLKLASLFI